MPASSSSSPARFDGRPRPEPALVGDERGGKPLSRRELGGCRAHPRRPLDRLGEAAGADGDDEEVLHVDACAARVGAARDHVHHRQRQKRRGPEQPPEGHALRGGPRRARSRRTRRARRSRPAGSDRAFRRARDRAASRPAWSAASRPAASGRDRLVDGRDGTPDALAAVALAAVAELAGLVAAGGRAGRHASRRRSRRRDANLARDRRRAAGVERLPREHGGDPRRAHLSASPSASQAASHRGRRLEQEARARASAPAGARSPSGTRPETCRRRGRA